MAENCVGIVGLVGDDMVGLEAGEQRNRQLGIAGVATREDKADGPTEGIDGDMPLGGQPSSGAPQSLVAEPPFWPVAAWA